MLPLHRKHSKPFLSRHFIIIRDLHKMALVCRGESMVHLNRNIRFITWVSNISRLHQNVLLSRSDLFLESRFDHTWSSVHFDPLSNDWLIVYIWDFRLWPLVRRAFFAVSWTLSLVKIGFKVVCFMVQLFRDCFLHHSFRLKDSPADLHGHGLNLFWRRPEDVHWSLSCVLSSGDLRDLEADLLLALAYRGVYQLALDCSLMKQLRVLLVSLGVFLS